MADPTRDADAIAGAETLGHADAVELLPWLALDKLAGDELAALCDHLKTCEACRRELPYLGELGRLVALGNDDAPGAAVGPGDALVEARLRRLAPRLPVPFRPRRAGGFWRQAALAQAALIVVVALFAWSRTPDQAPAAEAPYVTLSEENTEAAGELARWRLVPAAGIGEEALRALLIEAGLDIVGGPTARGVYTVAPREESQDLMIWRADPRVLLLERVAGSAG